MLLSASGVAQPLSQRARAPRTVHVIAQASRSKPGSKPGASVKAQVLAERKQVTGTSLPQAEAVDLTASLDGESSSRQEVDYAAIDAQPLNQVVMGLFRRKMVAAIGEDSKLQGYDAIIDLTRKLNSKFGSPRSTQVATVGILRSLFPAWLPRLFAVMFAKPFPAFSNQMNAWATALTCQWLMGPCKVNDVELENGQVLKAHGVQIDRCRYLEEAGCVSVCINSCKVPTQEFFEKDMGINVTLTPNYEDFSCQFSFGKAPGPQSLDDAFKSPCFSQCPSKRKRLELSTCSQVVPSS